MKSAGYEATLAEASLSPIHRAQLCSVVIHHRAFAQVRASFFVQAYRPAGMEFSE